MTETDTRTADQLAEAIRSGDTSITAADLAAARAREEHERLLVEARSREEIRRIEAERADKVDQLRTDIAAVVTDTDGLTALAADAAKALDQLVTAILTRNAAVDELARRARVLGVPPATTSNVPADGSGIGWHGGPGRDTVLVLDDRIIGTGSPLDLVDRIARDAIRDHRLHHRRWREASTPSVAHQLDMLDTVKQPIPTASVRLTRRWGKNQAGDVTTTDQSTAAWLVSHDMAQYA